MRPSWRSCHVPTSWIRSAMDSTIEVRGSSKLWTCCASSLFAVIPRSAASAVRTSSTRPVRAPCSRPLRSIDCSIVSRRAPSTPQTSAIAFSASAFASARQAELTTSILPANLFVSSESKPSAFCKADRTPSVFASAAPTLSVMTAFSRPVSVRTSWCRPSRAERSSSCRARTAEMSSSKCRVRARRSYSQFFSAVSTSWILTPSCEWMLSRTSFKLKSNFVWN
mmetsp:Transcript_123802/g.396300  ORF Transcript_123802/g.396300 Transcript_123802/m.396300 type:complete len:224 (-) Transcript_123802:1998-2669(-)